jgi:hypothetical protein
VALARDRRELLEQRDARVNFLDPVLDNDDLERIRQKTFGLRQLGERYHEVIRAPPRFVMLVTTQATVQGRAGFGLRHDVLAFPAEQGNFRRPKGEGSGPLGPDGGLDLPSTVRFQPAPTASALA